MEWWVICVIFIYIGITRTHGNSELVETTSHEKPEELSDNHNKTRRKTDKSDDKEYLKYIDKQNNVPELLHGGITEVNQLTQEYQRARRKFFTAGQAIGEDYFSISRSGRNQEPQPSVADEANVKSDKRLYSFEYANDSPEIDFLRRENTKPSISYDYFNIENFRDHGLVKKKSVPNPNRQKLGLQERHKHESACKEYNENLHLMWLKLSKYLGDIEEPNNRKLHKIALMVAAYLGHHVSGEEPISESLTNSVITVDEIEVLQAQTTKEIEELLAGHRLTNQIESSIIVERILNNLKPYYHRLPNKSCLNSKLKKLTDSVILSYEKYLHERCSKVFSSGQEDKDSVINTLYSNGNNRILQHQKNQVSKSEMEKSTQKLHDEFVNLYRSILSKLPSRKRRLLSEVHETPEDKTNLLRNLMNRILVQNKLNALNSENTAINENSPKKQILKSTLPNEEFDYTSEPNELMYELQMLFDKQSSDEVKSLTSLQNCDELLLERFLGQIGILIYTFINECNKNQAVQFKHDNDEDYDEKDHINYTASSLNSKRLYNKALHDDSKTVFMQNPLLNSEKYNQRGIGLEHDLLNSIVKTTKKTVSNRSNESRHVMHKMQSIEGASKNEPKSFVKSENGRTKRNKLLATKQPIANELKVFRKLYNILQSTSPDFVSQINPNPSKTHDSGYFSSNDVFNSQLKDSNVFDVKEYQQTFHNNFKDTTGRHLLNEVLADFNTKDSSKTLDMLAVLAKSFPKTNGRYNNAKKLRKLVKDAEIKRIQDYLQKVHSNDALVTKDKTLRNFPQFRELHQNSEAHNFDKQSTLSQYEKEKQIALKKFRPPLKQLVQDLLGSDNGGLEKGFKEVKGDKGNTEETYNKSQDTVLKSLIQFLIRQIYHTQSKNLRSTLYEGSKAVTADQVLRSLKEYLGQTSESKNLLKATFEDIFVKLRDLPHVNYPSMTNTGPKGDVELTYLLQHPHVLLFNPQTIIKHRLPYEQYTKNIQNIFDYKITSNDQLKLLTAVKYNADGTQRMLYNTSVPTNGPIEILNASEFRKEYERKKVLRKSEDNILKKFTAIENVNNNVELTKTLEETGKNTERNETYYLTNTAGNKDESKETKISSNSKEFFLNAENRNYLTKFSFKPNDSLNTNSAVARRDRVRWNNYPSNTPRTATQVYRYKYDTQGFKDIVNGYNKRAQSVQTNYRRRSDNTADIVENKTNIAENTTNIVESTTNIVENTTNIVENTSKMVEYTTGIIENTTNILENTTHINVNENAGDNDNVDNTQRLINT